MKGQNNDLQNTHCFDLSLFILFSVDCVACIVGFILTSCNLSSTSSTLSSSNRSLSLICLTMKYGQPKLQYSKI